MPSSIFKSQKIPAVLKVAAAGLIASLPMSIGMNLMYRALPEEEQYPLPPREITLAASERVGLRSLTREGNRRKIATGVGHFGYGSFGGALYALFPFHLPLPPLLKGMLFGAFFWAFGYMGWLPAVGILSPAIKHPPGRTMLTITAHIIYGIGLALIMDKQKKGGGRKERM